MKIGGYQLEVGSLVLSSFVQNPESTVLKKKNWCGTSAGDTVSCGPQMNVKLK